MGIKNVWYRDRLDSNRQRERKEQPKEELEKQEGKGSSQHKEVKGLRVKALKQGTNQKDY